MIRGQPVVVPLLINTRDGGFLQAKVKYTVYVYYVHTFFPVKYHQYFGSLYNKSLMIITIVSVNSQTEINSSTSPENTRHARKI